MFCKVAKYHCANICSNASTNIYTKYNSQFLTIFAQNLTILPENSKVLTYQLCSKAHMFCRVMDCQDANIYANASTNVYTKYIFLFFMIFT